MLSSRWFAGRMAIALLGGARLRSVRFVPPPKIAPHDAQVQANADKVAVRHLALDFNGKFDRRQLRGTATPEIGDAMAPRLLETFRRLSIRSPGSRSDNRRCKKFPRSACVRHSCRASSGWIALAHHLLFSLEEKEER